MHWFVYIPIVLLAACGGKAGDPLVGGASPECNDGDGRDAPTGLVEAFAVTGAKIEGCLFERDADAYYFEASPEAGGTVYGIALKPSAAMQGQIALYDASHSLLATVRDTNPGSTIYTWIHLAPGSRGYLKVSQIEANEAAPYQVNIAETTINEPSEPNDTPESATPLVLGEARFAHLSAAANRPLMAVDVYSFEVATAGEFEVVVSGLRNLEATLALAAPSGAIGKSESKAGATSLSLTKKLEAGPYTVSLSPLRPLPTAGTGTVPGRFADGYSISVTPK